MWIRILLSVLKDGQNCLLKELGCKVHLVCVCCTWVITVPSAWKVMLHVDLQIALTNFVVRAHALIMPLQNIVSVGHPPNTVIFGL